MNWFGLKYKAKIVIYPILNRRKENWAKVLEVMYERQMTVDQESIEESDGIRNSKLIDGYLKHTKIYLLTDLQSEEVTESIGYLKDMELIEEIGEGKASTYSLTYKGLQLAHQRKMERKQFYTNMILTLLLVILSAISAFPIIAPYLPF